MIYNLKSAAASLRTMLSGLVLLFSLGGVAWSQPAGYFGPPEVMQGLPLEKAGSQGWTGKVDKIEPLGGLAYPGDPVSLELSLVNQGKEPLTVTPTIEICRFASRLIDIKDWWKPDFVYEFVGTPVRTPLAQVTIDPGKSAVLPWASKPKEFAEFGAYAVILDLPGKGRQGVGTFVRLHAPNPKQGDGQKSPLIVSWGYTDKELPYEARIGYKWIRTDGTPSWGSVATRNQDGGPDGPFDWTKMDMLMDKFHQSGLLILSNMYGSPEGATTEANRKAFNMVHLQKYDTAWGLFVEEAVRRYCGADGSGPLQIIDYYNEPWEGGGISGWKSDAIRYRAIYKTIYDHAKKASTHIKVGGTSSIMNTCDKLLSVKDWQKQYGIDVFTDHYVQPHMMHGPRIAEKLGGISMDTETWCGKLDEQQTALAAHFIASGQKKVNSTHYASQLPWENGKGGPMFGNLAAAENFFMYFTGGREFTQTIFMDHLPWLYQWGEGKDAVFILSGNHNLLNYDRPILYSQINARGTISISTLGGQVKAYDLYGNLYPAANGKYLLPCGFRNVYLEAADPSLVIKAVNEGRMEQVKPVELFVDDFTVPLPQVKTVDVEIHNVLNRPITGTLKATTGASLTLAPTELPVALKPGESRIVQFPLKTAEVNPANAYQVQLSYTGADGAAEITDVLHVNTITFGTPTLDGTLATWQNAIPVISYGQDAKRSFVEAAWKPWEKDVEVTKGMAETRFMYDDQFLYIAVRERNQGWTTKPRLSTRDESSYYGKDDMAHTYIRGTGDAEPFSGNCVQVGIGLDLHQHPLAPYTKVPAKMIAVDDTDYEYAFWGAPAPNNPLEVGGVEIWRSMTPTMLPYNFLPRCMPEGYDGVPKGTKSAVKREGNDTIYQVAIPLTDMPELKPDAGKIIHLAYALPGSGIQAGFGRSRTRFNGLTLKATWNWDKYSNDLRWGFVK